MAGACEVGAQFIQLKIEAESISPSILETRVRLSWQLAESLMKKEQLWDDWADIL